MDGDLYQDGFYITTHRLAVQKPSRDPESPKTAVGRGADTILEPPDRVWG